MKNIYTNKFNHHLLFAAIIFITIQPLFAQNGVRIASTAGTADPSAMLDITSTNKGLLFPRVTLTSLTSNITPVNNPAIGLVVYNLGSLSVPATGIYFWNGSSWVQLSSGGLSGSGTTNQVAKWTASNAVGNSIITDNGTNVGIGSTLPNARLTIGTELGGSALSSTFVSNAGALGTTAGNLLNLANFAFTSANVSSLGLKALRTANGSSWTATAVGFLLDVDNTSPVNNAQIWLTAAGNVGVGTSSPNASAALDVTSNTRGFAMPRMTSVERKAIVAPMDGLQVYDTDLKGYYYFNGTRWDGVSVPAGTVIYFASNIVPLGYFACNGQTVNRTQFAELFATIGTTYGAGNGSTTFTLPDLRGEFIRGVDNARGVDVSRVFGSAQAQDWKGFSMTNTGQNTFAYSHGPVYMGKNVTPAAFVGNLFAGGWAAPSAAIGAQWDASEIRPRNVALLACIRY